MFAAAGCGSETAEVVGKVTYQGQLLTEGRLLFLAPGNARWGFCNIQPDGFYRVPDAPVGEVTIVVTTAATVLQSTQVKGKTAVAPNPTKSILIPKKYTSPETSPLTYEVRPGFQRFDIVLK